MAHLLVGYTTYTVHLGHEDVCTTPSSRLLLALSLVFLVPTFNLIVLEARTIRVLNRFTKGVKVI